MVLTCASLASGDADMFVGEEQNGQELTLKVGGLFEVRLPAQGGTGYSWYLDHLDSRYLELVSEETRKPQEVPPRVGGPVLHIWRFRALQEGRTDLKLDYFRHWEGRSTASKHFLLRVAIH